MVSYWCRMAACRKQAPVPRELSLLYEFVHSLDERRFVICVELRSRETRRPFGQGLQTAVAARRVGEGTTVAA